MESYFWGKNILLDVCNGYNEELLIKYVEEMKKCDNELIMQEKNLKIIVLLLENDDKHGWDLVKDSCVSVIKRWVEQYYSLHFSDIIVYITSIIIYHISTNNNKEFIYDILKEILNANKEFIGTFYVERICYVTLATRNKDIYEVLNKYLNDLEIMPVLVDLIDKEEYDMLDYVTDNGNNFGTDKFQLDLITGDKDAIYYFEFLQDRYFKGSDKNILSDLLSNQDMVDECLSTFIFFYCKNNNYNEQYRNTLKKLVQLGYKLKKVDYVAENFYRLHKNDVSQRLERYVLPVLDEKFYSTYILGEEFLKIIVGLTGRKIQLNLKNVCFEKINTIKKMVKYYDYTIDFSECDISQESFSVVARMIDSENDKNFEFLIVNNIVNENNIDYITEYCVKKGLYRNLLKLNELSVEGVI